MATAGSIVIDLLMKTGAFETDTKRAEKRMRAMEKEINAVAKSIGQAFLAIGAVAGAGLGLYIRNTIEAEKVQAQLEARIKSTGSAAGLTIDDLNGMADALQRATTFDDEGIGEVQSMLLTFTKISKDTFQDATEAILDMSVAMNQGLKESAIQVGKALNDPILGVTALRRVGVQLTKDQEALIRTMVETGDVAGAQRVILQELATQMGGSARAARETLGGALTGLKNNFDNLLEGDTNEGGLRGTVDEINALSDALTDEDLKDGIDELASGLAGLATGALKAAAGFGSLIGKYREWLADQGFSTDLDDMSMEQLEKRRARIQKQLSQFDPLGIGDAITGDTMRKQLAEVEQAIKGFGFRDVTGSATGSWENTPAPAAAGGTTSNPSAQIRDRAEATRELSLAEQELLEYRNSLNRSAEESTRMLADAEAAERARREDAQRMLEDLQFELDLLGMSNDERERAIALRYANADAASAEGRAIIEQVDRLQREREAMADRVDAMDSLRDSTRGFLHDLKEGEGLFDSLTEAVDRLADTLFDLIAQGLIDQLFGKQGDAGGGNFGDAISSFFGMFGFGGAKAGGGDVMPRNAYLVGEEGPEMFVPRTAGLILPAAQTAMVGAGAGVTQVNHFQFAAPTDPRTQTQMAAKTGAAAQRALSRNR